MKESPATFRVFISSPGDVSEEREQADLVIKELDAHFGPQVELEVILWENLGIGADASFQEGINRLLEEGGGIDVAVFILWSRIGSEVGGKLKREDGTRWKSGTQAEFYLMLEARNQSQDDPKRPEILAYVRNDDDGFRRRVVSQPSSEMEVLLNQKKALDEFIQVEFNDEKGRNLRAYYSYPEPVTFANQLEVHLRAIIERLLGDRTVVSRWSSDPYRGLSAFDIEHAEIFCGRDQQILELENLFRERHRQFLDSSREQRSAVGESESLPFVVILGSSGSGKSSLARAGLAAKLCFRNRDPTVRQWRVATFIPTASEDRLLRGLAKSLEEEQHGFSELNAADAAVIAEHLTESPAKLAEAGLDLASKKAGGEVRLLLIVDQFEELLSSAVSSDERDRFLDELLAMAKSGRVWILATLRSDFYAAAQLEDRFRLLKGRDGGFDLVAPSLGDLRHIIEDPAHMAGLHFELDPETDRSLADVILEDATRGESLGLPLLQDALQELYQRRDGEGGINFEAYRQMGAIRGCLQKRITRIMESLDPEEVARLPILFRDLVTIETDSGQVVRQRVSKSRLSEEKSIASLVERLSGSEARLLSASGDGEDAAVSLAHEALISAWPQLEAWIESNRKGLLDRAEALRACRRWEESGRPDSLLLPGGLMLDSALNLLSQFSHLLEKGSNLEEYVHLSRGRHRRKKVMVRASLIAVVAAVGFFLWYASHQAAQERQLESEKTLAIQRLGFEVLSSRIQAFLEKGDPFGALYLAAEDPEKSLGSFGPRSATVRALGSVSRHLVSMAKVPEESRFDPRERDLSLGVISIAWKPGGEELAAGTRGGTIHTWDFTSGNWNRAFLPNGVKGLGSAAKSVCWLDDHVIAAVYENGVVGLHDERESSGSSFESLGEGIGHGEVLPDGSLVVSERSTDKIHLLGDLKKLGEQKEESISGRVTAVAASENEMSALAIEGGAGKQAEITFRRDGEAWTQSSSGARIASLAIHSDHELLAAAATGVGVELFGLAGGERVGFLPFSETITDLDWHPDAPWLAATTAAGELVIWKLEKRIDNFGVVDFSQREPSLRILAHRETALSLSWSPDGNRIATGSDDGTVGVWALTPGDLAFLQLPVITGPGFRGVAVSPDGKWVAGGGEDGKVSVWALDSLNLVGPPLSLGRAPVQSLAWHPTLPLLAAGGVRGEVQISTWPEGRVVGKLGKHDDTVWKLRWSPDGEALVSSSWDRTVGLWSKSGERIASWQGHEDYVQGLAVSPDGSTVATGATDGRIWFWDAASGKHTKTWEGHGPGKRVAVCALDFSPDGELIASAGNDGRVILWEVESGRQIKIFEGHEGEVESVAFNPSGDMIASAGDDGTVWVWQRNSLEPFFSYPAHRASIANLCWMPGLENIVVTASADGSLGFLPCSQSWWEKRLKIFEIESVEMLSEQPEKSP